MSGMSNLPKIPECQNCGAATGSNFCPECGQDCRDHTVSLKLLFHDFIDDVFTFDSRFFRSFVPLLIKPGALTLEYTRGRRIRYIPPLRLYLLVSLLFFFVVSVQVRSQMSESQWFQDTRIEATPDSAMVATVLEEIHDLGLAHEDSARLDLVLAGLAARADEDQDDDDGAWLQVGSFSGESRNVDSVAFVTGLLKLVPKAMFLLLPVFAALLALIYRRSRRRFIEHLVFSLHYHAFLFLLFTIAILVDVDVLHLIVFFGMQVYLYVALRRIYMQGWRKTGLKFFLLTGAYNTVLFTLLVLVAVSTAELMELRETHPMIVQWIMS